LEAEKKSGPFWSASIKLSLFVAATFLWMGCSTANNNPVFDHFTYEGNDPVYEDLEIGDDEFVNPIIAGFYPDPSIVRVEDDYYMIHSSFSYFPGIPIFHSKDLVNWTQIGNVLDRPSQMNLDSLRMSRGVFAATIEYHEGTFYVLNTLVDAGGNFMVTATDPAGPWSDPIWLDRVGGIDPSIYFDDDGKVYVINNDAPEGEPLYQGHRAIWIREYDLATNKSISEPKVIINGGVDISKKPVWIEGPHLIKVGDDYYLHAAEGGTGPDHSQVVLKGKSPLGPFTPYEGNPILTQRTISPDREFAVEYTGHADMVETANGEWWTIFLGVRPYDGRNFNTGRETFLLPVTWKDGWPVILEESKPVPVKLKKPDLPEQPAPDIPTHGNFTVTEEFTAQELAPYWLFMRTPREKWYETGNGSLTITARPDHISGLGQPSFIGRRQQHAYASFSTTMRYTPEHVGDEAGLVANQNGSHYFFFGVGTDHEGRPELQLRQRIKDEVSQLKAFHINTEELSLKIEAKGDAYNFYYAEGADPEHWKLFYENADGTILSTETAGGFVGTVVGMYAYSNPE
tara:strand:+ start:7494 stop:9203 length:1710 start_codon:yes stop_codon:yes gene_type:complete